MNTLKLWSAASLLTLLAVGCSQLNDAPTGVDGAARFDPGRATSIKPIASNMFGHDYRYWATAWGTWAYQCPTYDDHGTLIYPILDETGQYAATNQNDGDHIFFLAGYLNGNPAITRSVTISHDDALFFPIVNAIADTTGNWTPNDVNAFLDWWKTTVTSASITIDGVTTDVTNHWARSDFYDYTLPQHDLYDLFGIPGYENTTCAYGRSDGIWVMLTPLSVGTHTIAWTASNADGVMQDITYHLTVN